MRIDLNNPKHRMMVFIVGAVVIAIVFGTVGYFASKSAFKKALEAAATPTPTPTPSVSPSPKPSATVTATATKTSTAGAEIDKLKEEKTSLQTQLDSANSENSNLKNGINTAKAYNAFLEYMTQVIDAHDGFTGWTDAEYQVGREKAQATGNQTFVNTVDAAWNNEAIDVATRVAEVFRGISSGISGALQ